MGGMARVWWDGKERGLVEWEGMDGICTEKLICGIGWEGFDGWIGFDE
jgi:hypothetical protein